MPKLNRLVVISIAAIAVLTAAVYAVSLWVNDQNASVVLGQPNFNSSTPASGLNQTNSPWGMAIDASTGKVFVVDTGNSRVMRFSSAAAATSGSAAEAIFGGSGATSATTMLLPRAAVVDSLGNLWVADTNNNRLLKFVNAATAPSGAPASVVLGQTLFTTNTASTTATAMNFPVGVFVDSGGHLWLADASNNRVLRFDSAATLGNGSSANVVIGQPNFATSTPATTQTGMNLPIGVFLDSGGRLWVSDTLNMRVLRYDSALLIANAAPANGVLGQPGFVTNAAPNPPTAASMVDPEGVWADSSGRLYVGDINNNRVLIFNSAAAKANGANADNVLGQTDFVSNTQNSGGLSASSFFTPRMVAFDETSGNLWVGDTANNRVLRFAPAGTSAANVTISGRVLDGRGSGIRGARVTMQDSRGHTLTAVTNSFGYYTFASVQSGDTYIGQAAARGSTFAPRVVTINDAIADLDFTAR